MAEYGIVGFTAALDLETVVSGMADIFPSFHHFSNGNNFNAVGVAQEWLEAGSLSEAIEALDTGWEPDRWPPRVRGYVITVLPGMKTEKRLEIRSYNERCTITVRRGGRVGVSYRTPTLNHVPMIQALLAADETAQVQWQAPDGSVTNRLPHGVESDATRSLPQHVF